MKIIISENIINEALKASEFRPLMKISRELAMERINQVWPRLEAQADSKNRSADKKKESGDRLYFNLEKSEEEEFETPSKDKIISYLNQANYEVVDFKEGLVRKKGDKNIIKIGKVLTMLSKSDPEAKNLLNTYNNEKSVMALDEPDDYVMVISRHPYDIGGMSTDRVWRSCMNLRDGEERQYVPIDIKKGTIISYLLNKNDLNIKNPIAKISIKPFISVSNKKDVLYGIEQESVKYGRQHEAYVKKLINVLDIAQKEKTGIFKRDKKLYSDNIEREFIANLSKEDVEKFKSKIKEFRDGLTLEKTIEKYYWVLKANIQDAIIGEDRNLLVWYDGLWKNGYWMNGLWKNGVWKNGTWKNGEWENGTWGDGKWEFGMWDDGIWKGGMWKNGYWMNGVWENGIWEKGTWNNGIWKKGVWENGTWVDGTWKVGTWKGGKIWDWDADEYVESPQPPK